MKQAVIDIGTNSTRLAVAESIDGIVQMRHTEVAETRLGEGMGIERMIRPIPLERNVKAIKDFVQKAETMQVEHIRLTATSALRDAQNKEAVQQRILQSTGYSVELLSGTEEARLSYLGASGDFVQYHRPLAVLDIGGGSTELVYPVAEGLHSASVNMGAVRLLEHPELQAQMTDTLATLKADDFPANAMLIAVGGTNTCLMAMELGMTQYDGNKIHGQSMTKQQVDAWCERLFALSQEEREQIPGMKRKRADIIPYGVQILQKTMELLQQTEVTISDKGLVYGLLQETFA